jgi:putative transposase
VPDRDQLLSRKKIRLDPEVYADTGNACSITIATASKRTVFAYAKLANAAVTILKDHSQKTGVPIYAYCIMPDHVHLLLSASSQCGIVAFVGQYKSLVQRSAWGLGIDGLFWQKRFWDHFLRQEEALEVTANYILNNPVRRGLVSEASEYRYSGTLVFEL